MGCPESEQAMMANLLVNHPCPCFIALAFVMAIVAVMANEAGRVRSANRIREGR